jgi:hypothetical protein
MQNKKRRNLRRFFMINIFMTQVFLRSPQVASRAFGTSNQGQYMTAVPKPSFEFYVQFFLSPGAQTMLGNSNTNAINTYNGNRSLTFKVKTVDRPKVNLIAEDLNQYNKKVVVYKKIEYQDASLTLYDTVDNSPLATWVDYFTYYFADSRRTTSPTTPSIDYAQSPVDPTFSLGAGWGFMPILDAQTNFFTGISVYALFANTYTAFNYVNPKITSVDWGNQDYSSSDPTTVNLTLKYEALDYFAFAQPISSTGAPYGYMPNFGVDADDFINPSQTAAFQTQGAIPRIFGTSTNLNTNPTIALPTSQSNNLSNPTTATPPPTAGTGPIAFAPGASLPAAVIPTTSLSTNLNFGTKTPTPNNFTAQTITQQIAQQSGQIAITSAGGGLQYTNTLTGQPLTALPSPASALLANPKQSNNPIISATALSLAAGHYESSVPQQLVQSIASVAAYVAATQGIPVSTLITPAGPTLQLLAAYNALAPSTTAVGVVNQQISAWSPPWPRSPTLRGSLSAAIIG